MRRIALVVLMFGGLATITWQRASLWARQDQMAALWAHTNPASSRAQATAAIFEMRGGRPDRAVARLQPLSERNPADLQLAVNLADARCAVRGLTHHDVDAVAFALRNATAGDALMHAWLADALDIARTRGCRGLNLEAFDTWLAAARANPRFAALPRQQELHSIAGELALTRGQPDAARLEFDRALDAWPTPQAALQQAALLASAGCLRAGARPSGSLRCAASPAQRADTSPARPATMAMLHAPCCASSVTGPTHSRTCAPPSTTTCATTAPRNADDPAALPRLQPQMARAHRAAAAACSPSTGPGLIGGFVFDDYPNIVDNPTLKLDTLDGPALARSGVLVGRRQPAASDLDAQLRGQHVFRRHGSGRDEGDQPRHPRHQCAAGAGPGAAVVRACRAWRRCTTPHMGRSLRRRRVGGASDQHDGVLYIVQRMESLAHTFVFAGLWLYLIGRQRQLAGESGRWWIAAGLFGGTALGILCKESAVLVAAVCMARRSVHPGAAQFAAEGRRAQAVRGGVVAAAGRRPGLAVRRASRRPRRSARATSPSTSAC